MKAFRLSPWLILALLASVMVIAGCERPYPQEPVPTPAPMNVPTQAPAVNEQAPDTGGVATPTLPAIINPEGTPVPDQALPGEPTLSPEEVTAQALVPTQAPPAEETAAAGAQPTAVPPAQPTAAAQTTSGGNVVYTVKSGDTLFSIGRVYNVNPYAIAAANNIPYPYIIYPGQQLVIPTGTPPPPGPTPIPPKPGVCRYYHTVKPGENLYRISLAYGVSMNAIAAANGITNYNLIYAGQTLCIP
jgi:LysM repeat protein